MVHLSRVSSGPRKSFLQHIVGSNSRITVWVLSTFPKHVMYSGTNMLAIRACFFSTSDGIPTLRWNESTSYNSQFVTVEFFPAQNINAGQVTWNVCRNRWVASVKFQEFLIFSDSPSISEPMWQHFGRLFRQRGWLNLNSFKHRVRPGPTTSLSEPKFLHAFSKATRPATHLWRPVLQLHLCFVNRSGWGPGESWPWQQNLSPTNGQKRFGVKARLTALATDAALLLPERKRCFQHEWVFETAIPNLPLLGHKPWQLQLYVSWNLGGTYIFEELLWPQWVFSVLCLWLFFGSLPWTGIPTRWWKWKQFPEDSRHPQEIGNLERCGGNIALWWGFLEDQPYCSKHAIHFELAIFQSQWNKWKNDHRHIKLERKLGYFLWMWLAMGVSKAHMPNMLKQSPCGRERLTTWLFGKNSSWGWRKRICSLHMLNNMRAALRGIPWWTKSLQIISGSE